MITIEQSIKISATLDKMGLTIPEVKPGKNAQAQLGADMMLQVLTKLHKAKEEIYELVAEIKGCTKAEAKKVDLVDFIKSLGEIEGIKDFLSSAVTSQPTD